jgi:biotin synthase
MCLAIPNKIIEVKKDKALIQAHDHLHEVDLSLVGGAKIGDWILCVNDLAIQKIPKEDAEEIINLLEIHEKSKFRPSKKFQEIMIRASTDSISKDDIIYLLNSEGKEKEILFAKADETRRKFLQELICIHGIIEFSNFCKNDCYYCGLSGENRSLKRYRMSIDEIVERADWAVNGKGYKLLVLQSGEDYFYADETLVEIIRRIKKKCKAFIFMSIGERGYECYKKMKEAGASGVLFRFETSNPKIFKKIHPEGKNFENRFEHLKFMKELGYFIATGSIIGLPGQSIEDLADDILMARKWANMVSMGPYVPAANTPLGQIQSAKIKMKDDDLECRSSKGARIYEDGERAELNLKMISILRLLKPAVRIPVVTALETLLGQEGRKRALQAGANSLMFNLTPEKYRPHYNIYDNKFFQKENIWEKYGLFRHEESYQMLEERMRKEISNS